MIALEFERIGKRLFSEHLVGGNFGNISIRDEQTGFYIKRTGAYLDVATAPVYVPLEGDVPADASTEFRVHREVYRKTPHRAIVHAHPPAVIALSLVQDSITPEDCEGVMFCPVIPVVSGKPGSEEIAKTVSDALTGSKVVIARGHGTFAAGRTLDEAYVYTSVTEHACRVLVLRQNFIRF